MKILLITIITVCISKMTYSQTPETSGSPATSYMLELKRRELEWGRKVEKELIGSMWTLETTHHIWVTKYLADHTYIRSWGAGYDRGYWRVEGQRLFEGTTREELALAIKSASEPSSDSGISKGGLVKKLTDFKLVIYDSPDEVTTYTRATTEEVKQVEENERAIRARQSERQQKSFNILHKPVDHSSGDSLNTYAWFLATCPDDSKRNGKLAVTYARKACELTEVWPKDFVETLAAACAEVGDFRAAVKYQKYAMEGRSDFPDRPEMEKALELYEKGKPYRE
jgi:hypothetical protein